MTGRDIQEKITGTKFFAPNALAFEEAIRQGRHYEMETPELALEFLTLYCVSLMTAEPDYQYDETRLLETYEFVHSNLKKNKSIANTDFLSNPPKKYFLILLGALCLVRYP